MDEKLEQLEKDVQEIKDQRLHLSEKVEYLQKYMESESRLQEERDKTLKHSIDGIKKTLENANLELVGSEFSENRSTGRESLFVRVEKNTQFRLRTQWTIALLIGINSLLTTGIVGIVVVAIINYLSSPNS